MRADFSDEKLVREYLLGFLAAEEQDRIERRFLADSGFENLVAVIEDEMIEEYMEGALPRGERRAIEEHFLLPPERQRKLQFARALRSRLQSQAEPAMEAERNGWRRLPFRWPPMLFAGASAALVAVVVMAGSALYIGRLNQNLKKEIEANKVAQAVLQAELTGERERIKLLEAAGELLTVVPIQANRSTTTPWHIVTPNAETRWIKASIPLVDELPPFSVVIRTEAGIEISTTSGLQPDFRDGGKQLVFYIPAQHLLLGQYIITLTAGHGTHEKYKFTVSR